MTPADEILMGQVRAGDLRKLALLFERHHRPLYNYFVHVNGDRDLSEDLVQEVFFRMLRYRATYDETRKFSAWMYQIARNINAEKLGQRKGELRLVSTQPEEEEEYLAEPVSSALGAEELLGKRQELSLLKRALHRLPEEKREVLVLSRIENMKYEQIAELLGIEVGAVKVRVFRAIRALGQIYSELSGEKAS